VKARWLVLGIVVVGVIVSAAVLWQRVAPASALTVKKVLVDVDPAAVAANVDREAVRAVVQQVLGDARGVTFDERARDAAVVRVRVERYASLASVPLPAGHPPTDGEAGAGSSSLSLVVEVIEGQKTTARGHAVATAHGQVGADALVSQALRDALRQVQQARAADALDSDTLLTWLDPSAADIGDAQRRRAMQALASRGERRATAPVARLLASPDAELAATALQALTVLGDPDAIDAIVDYAAKKPPLVRQQCVDALRATGSPKAAPWLFTISSGHPDMDVQAYARAALEQLAPDVLAPATAVAEASDSGKATGLPRGGRPANPSSLQ
jgi:hypothetical protein